MFPSHSLYSQVTLHIGFSTGFHLIDFSPKTHGTYLKIIGFSGSNKNRQKKKELKYSGSYLNTFNLQIPYKLLAYIS